MNILKSILSEKCPRCRRGDLFLNSAFTKGFLDMPKNCPHCGQATSPEPGFYYGAMFISYIFTGFLYLGIVGSLILGLGLSVNAAFAILLFFVAVSYTKTARLARSVWIHMMVGYDKN